MAAERGSIRRTPFEDRRASHRSGVRTSAATSFHTGAHHIRCDGSNTSMLKLASGNGRCRKSIITSGSAFSTRPSHRTCSSSRMSPNRGRWSSCRTTSSGWLHGSDNTLQSRNDHMSPGRPECVALPARRSYAAMIHWRIR